MARILKQADLGLFFKDTQTVTINAADNSGTVFISYLVTDRDLSEAELNPSYLADMRSRFA